MAWSDAARAAAAEVRRMHAHSRRFTPGELRKVAAAYVPPNLLPFRFDRRGAARELRAIRHGFGNLYGAKEHGLVYAARLSTVLRNQSKKR